MSRGHLKKEFEKLDRANKALSTQRTPAQLSLERKHQKNLEARLWEAYGKKNDKKLCSLINIRKSLLFHPLVQYKIEEGIRQELLQGSSKFFKELAKAIREPSITFRKSHLALLNEYLSTMELFGFNYNKNEGVEKLRNQLIDEFEKSKNNENNPICELLYDKGRFYLHLVRSGLRSKKSFMK